MRIYTLTLFLIALALSSCSKKIETKAVSDSTFIYKEYIPSSSDLIINRTEYLNRLHGKQLFI